MKPEEYTFFNYKTGDFRQSNANDMIPFELRVNKLPKRSCKKCYGRGYVGIGKKHKNYELCPKIDQI